MQYAIETRNLSRRFGRTEAVVDLTMTVPAGSVFALVGPNGAGKTTTIKTLMNLLRPSAGRRRCWAPTRARSARRRCSASATSPRTRRCPSGCRSTT